MKKKLSGSVSVFISSLILLFILPGSVLRTLAEYLRRYGPGRGISRYLQYYGAADPAILFITLIVIAAALILVISFFRIIFFSSRLKSSGTARRSAKHVTEEAINCGHSTGKAKYLEQIEGYLKTGLIDRSEYNTLKARYEKLNIPDDYHG